MLIRRQNRAGNRAPIGLATLNRASLQAKGLVGWWPLMEGVGVAPIDLSGQNNNAVFDGITADRWGIRNDLSRYVNFTLTQSERITVSNSATSGHVLDFLTGDAFTLSCRARITTFGASFQSLIAKRGASGYQYHFRFSSGKLSFLASNGSGTSSIVRNAGQWYDLDASIDSTGLVSLYVDGVLDFTVAGRTFTHKAEDVTFGNVNFDNQHVLNGDIQRCRIYNCARSAQEIATQRQPQLNWDLYKQNAIGADVGVFEYVSAAVAAGPISPGGMIVNVNRLMNT